MCSTREMEITYFASPEEGKEKERNRNDQRNERDIQSRISTPATTRSELGGAESHSVGDRADRILLFGHLGGAVNELEIPDLDRMRRRSPRRILSEMRKSRGAENAGRSCSCSSNAII